MGERIALELKWNGSRSSKVWQGCRTGIMRRIILCFLRLESVSFPLLHSGWPLGLSFSPCYRTVISFAILGGKTKQTKMFQNGSSVFQPKSKIFFFKWFFSLSTFMKRAQSFGHDLRWIHSMMTTLDHRVDRKEGFQDQGISILPLQKVYLELINFPK